MKTLIICNDPPYGTERSWNGLRLAGALTRRPGVEVRVFLLGDAVGCAVAGQKVPDGYYHLDRMLGSAARHGAEVGCCGTGLDARGITGELLVKGARRSSLEELWVMTGTRRPGQVSAQRARLRRAGIEVLQVQSREIDLTHRRVKTSEAEIGFDRLVIALGAELAPGALPGFTEAAHNLYTLDGVTAAGEALRRFEGGRVAVAVSSLPYKCPAAPYEAAFLTEALLRRRVRDHATIDIYTPEPFPMPTAGPVLGEALAGMLADRGIGFHPSQVIERIEPQARELVLAGGQRAGYDLLLGIPAHRAPEAAAASGLAGGTGFLPVDPATSAEGVFAVGDVTAIPLAGGKFLPKAGVFAEAEAKVVARNIAAELAGHRPTATFDGACFAELGDGRGAFAAGHFYAPGGRPVRLRRPGRHWHLAKVAFEQYWMRRWL